MLLLSDLEMEEVRGKPRPWFSVPNQNGHDRFLFPLDAVRSSNALTDNGGRTLKRRTRGAEQWLIPSGPGPTEPLPKIACAEPGYRDTRLQAMETTSDIEKERRR